MVILGVKIIASLLLMAAVCSATFYNPGPRGTHNLILCNSYNGVSKYSDRIIVQAGLFKVNEQIVTFPPYGISTDIITCIRVIDRVSNNGGGYVEVQRGGVGYRDVQLRLTSQWGRKMDFDIEIFGEPAGATSTSATSI